MNKQELISAFEQLGLSFLNLPESIVHQAHINNQWFTSENIYKATKSWNNSLKKDQIEQWLQNEDLKLSEQKVGVIMAGNIPMVGLHDLLCVLASGKIAILKLSSQDEVLMKHVVNQLIEINPKFTERIIISDSLKQIDALIATGSNNSSRYFEYYFKDIPKIIRKSRTSIAVLNGKETDEELLGLSHDIYSYFGLGCRNVTHLLLPKDFELKRLYEAYDAYIDIVNHHKYYNNYMYHKSILLMNLTKHYDNGFMIFQEKEDLFAPISTLNYHFYQTEQDYLNYIEQHAEGIQCVLSKEETIIDKVMFGNAQHPSLQDYADHVNVLDFLKSI